MVSFLYEAGTCMWAGPVNIMGYPMMRLLISWRLSYQKGDYPGGLHLTRWALKKVRLFLKEKFKVQWGYVWGRFSIAGFEDGGVPCIKDQGVASWRSSNPLTASKEMNSAINLKEFGRVLWAPDENTSF